MKQFKLCFTFSLIFLTLMLPSCKKDGEIGSFADNRNGYTYRTVRIGKNIWFAENLRIEMDESLSYDDDDNNKANYGLLYTYNAAKRACPVGWRLPTKQDFEELLQYTGYTLTESEGKLKFYKGKNLAAKHGWNNEGGDDKFHFSALPGGYYSDDWDLFLKLGEQANFWSSTESNDENSYSMGIWNSKANLGPDSNEILNSVRCIKD